MNLFCVNADRAQILLLFYKPSSTDPVLNRLVAVFDPPYCHVEMAFPERYGEEPWQRDIWGSSIYQGECIFYKNRSYQRDGYVCITLEVSLLQQIKVKNYCRRQAEAGVRFNSNAMYMAYLPVQLMHTNGTFCSKHITEALQYGGVVHVKDLNAALSTPSRLHKHVCKNSPSATSIVQMIPSRMLRDRAEWSSRMLQDMADVSCKYSHINLLRTIQKDSLKHPIAAGAKCVLIGKAVARAA